MTASAGMPRRRKRAQYQQVGTFKRGRMVGLQEAGLSYRDIAACKGHATMKVMCVWSQWREEGRTQRRAGTGPHNVITAWDDRHLVHMVVMDLSASTVCHGLLRAELVAHMPLCRLPLSRDHQRLRLQWAHESHH